MLKSYDRLTWPLVNQFLGRKKANVLCVVMNVKTNEVFPIPQGVEHITYVPEILGIERENSS